MHGHRSSQGSNYKEQDKQADASGVEHDATRASRREPFRHASMLRSNLVRMKSVDATHNKNGDTADYNRGHGSDYDEAVQAADAADADSKHAVDKGWSLVKGNRETKQYTVH